jgi:rare lipoprotein A
MRSTERHVLVFVACVGLLVGCARAEDREAAQVGGTASPAEEQAESPGGEAQTGTATVYAGMLEGRETAAGEPFDHEEMVAAHRTHPLGTQVRVTNLENDRSVTVRIADRIPAQSRAIIDLSRRAARELGIGEQGQAQVRVEVVE